MRWFRRKPKTYKELEFDVELFDVDPSDVLYRYQEAMYNEAFDALEDSE